LVFDKSPLMFYSFETFSKQDVFKKPPEIRRPVIRPMERELSK
jgi:hypothetical protein